MNYLTLLPKVLPLAIKAIRLVEDLFGGGSGEVKKAAVIELVKTSIFAFEDFSEKDIVDDALFNEGIGNFVDGLVKVLNSVNAFND